MDRLQVALISTVLKETLDQITVVNRGRHAKCTNLTKISIQNRFENKVHESVYQELDPFEIAADDLNKIKLQNDISFFETYLCKTIGELFESGSWNSLEEALKNENQIAEEEQQLQILHKTNSACLKEYKEKEKKKFTKSEVRLRMLDEMLAEVKNDFKNAGNVSKIELSLVDKWEKTRFEQAKLVLERDECDLKTMRKEFDYKRQNEERIICDIQNYNSLKIENYESQSVYWQEKYKTELTELNAKIKTLSDALMERRKKRSRHQDVFDERQQAIDDYKAKKEQERLEFEIEENRINSAIRIQAWWRGVMVRRHLGPYRKKKKGKKGKKGK